jgi:hypothetical protein
VNFSRVTFIDKVPLRGNPRPPTAFSSAFSKHTSARAEATSRGSQGQVTMSYCVARGKFSIKS